MVSLQVIIYEPFFGFVVICFFVSHRNHHHITQRTFILLFDASVCFISAFRRPPPDFLCALAFLFFCPVHYDIVTCARHIPARDDDFPRLARITPYFLRVLLSSSLPARRDVVRECHYPR